MMKKCVTLWLYPSIRFVSAFQNLTSRANLILGSLDEWMSGWVNE